MMGNSSVSFFQIEATLKRRKIKRPSPVKLIPTNRGLKVSQMYPDLMQTPRDGTALDQRMCPVGFDGVKHRLGRLAFFADFGDSFGRGDKIAVYELLIVFADSLYDGMIDFVDFSVFKLHRQVPVGGWILGNHQTSGGLLVQAMTQLGICCMHLGKVQDVLRLMSIV